jgi:pectate lyase
MISHNNHEPSTFNINVNISKNASIIQIKKPFYGNVLKIEMNVGKKTIFLPSEYVEPFYVPDDIDRNFRYWLRQCIFQKELYIYEPKDEFDFKFKCDKNKNRTNISIEYNEFNIEGFLSLS